MKTRIIIFIHTIMYKASSVTVEIESQELPTEGERQTETWYPEAEILS